MFCYYIHDNTLHLNGTPVSEEFFHKNPDYLTCWNSPSHIVSAFNTLHNTLPSSIFTGGYGCAVFPDGWVYLFISPVPFRFSAPWLYTPNLALLKLGDWTTPDFSFNILQSSTYRKGKLMNSTISSPETRWLISENIEEFLSR